MGSGWPALDEPSWWIAGFRHPGYAGSQVTLTGLGLTLGNWGSLVVLSAGTLIAHLPRIRVGERGQERKRLIPGVW
jgi:protein-S-isoprenylcysteine O-methyltransferase Ste14